VLPTCLMKGAVPSGSSSRIPSQLLCTAALELLGPARASFAISGLSALNFGLEGPWQLEQGLG
jgi:hypothetical protein